MFEIDFQIAYDVRKKSLKKKPSQKIISNQPSIFRICFIQDLFIFLTFYISRFWAIYKFCWVFTFSSLYGWCANSTFILISNKQEKIIKIPAKNYSTTNNTHYNNINRYKNKKWYLILILDQTNMWSNVLQKWTDVR